jgi:hypothetical protein
MSHSLDAARKTVAVGPNGRASPAANSAPRCSISREQRPCSGDGEVDETDKAAVTVDERERRVTTLNGFGPERGFILPAVTS